jgi:glycerol-3-phosphate dehydrogenase
VNAAGPWVRFAARADRRRRRQGECAAGAGLAHRRAALYDHDRAYIFQNADGRIVFAIPYQRDFTLIGTTDRDYDGDPAKVKATQEEIAYLCAAVSEYFAQAGEAGGRGVDLFRRAAAL